MRAAIACCILASIASAQDVFNSTTWGRRLVYKRQAMPKRTWPDGVIPIRFASGYPEAIKPAVRLGMKVWENTTCVRFVEKSSGVQDWVEVVNGGSCQSSVGRIGGRQPVILGPDCNGVGSTSHELGHCIGLQHMQTRPDRDQYVTIYRNRTSSAMYDLNYAIESDSSSMGFPYDYTSLLHYGPYEMSIYPNLPVIVPKDPAYKETMGNYYPSFYDISRVNALYNCDARCSGYNTVCYNNGVKDVNDCTRCRCPGGYGGTDCSGDPEGAIILTATSQEQEYSTTLGEMNDPVSIDYAFEHIVIKAPSSQRIVVQVSYMWASYDSLCNYGGLEMFTKVDTRMGPPRICAMNMVAPSYTSESNRFYIKIFKRIYQVQATFTYRFI